MTENVPPGTASKIATKEDAGPRGLPYYEKLRRDLRDTLNRKRQLDRSLVRRSQGWCVYTADPMCRLRWRPTYMRKRPPTWRRPRSQAISLKASTTTSNHLLSAQHPLVQVVQYQVQQQAVEWGHDARRLFMRLIESSPEAQPATQRHLRAQTRLQTTQVLPQVVSLQYMTRRRSRT